VNISADKVVQAVSFVLALTDLNKDAGAGKKNLSAVGRMGNLSFTDTHRFKEGWGPLNRQNWVIGACH